MTFGDLQQILCSTFTLTTKVVPLLGRALFNTSGKTILKGTYFIAFTGDVTQEASDLDESGDDTSNDKYRFQLTAGKTTFIVDAACRGTPATNINHSCEPNTAFEVHSIRVRLHYYSFLQFLFFSFSELVDSFTN